MRGGVKRVTRESGGGEGVVRGFDTSARTDGEASGTEGIWRGW